MSLALDAGLTRNSRSVPRVEDDRLLRGGARFVDDIDLPGTLHAVFALLPHRPEAF